jgi:hypothetical protein
MSQRGYPVGETESETESGTETESESESGHKTSFVVHRVLLLPKRE